MLIPLWGPLARPLTAEIKPAQGPVDETVVVLSEKEIKTNVEEDNEDKFMVFYTGEISASVIPKFSAKLLIISTII